MERVLVVRGSIVAQHLVLDLQPVLALQASPPQVALIAQVITIIASLTHQVVVLLVYIIVVLIQDNINTLRSINTSKSDI